METSGQRSLSFPNLRIAKSSATIFDPPCTSWGKGKQEANVGLGLGRNDPSNVEVGETQTQSFTSSKAKQTADRTWPGQIDTLMRFTDEKRGRGGDNSFPSQRFAKCILTCEVRPKPIYAPNHS